jgi:hypothetical protein
VTWLDGLPDGETDWDRLAGACPEAFHALAGTLDATAQDTDPVLLELARLRIAKLLRNQGEFEHRSERAGAAGLSEQKIGELSSWPTSNLFDDRERACLDLTEQFVMDANGVTDEQVARVTGYLGGSGCYAFVEAVSVLETFQRACLTLGIRTWPGADVVTEQFRRKERAESAVSPTEVRL